MGRNGSRDEMYVERTVVARIVKWDELLGTNHRGVNCHVTNVYVTQMNTFMSSLLWRFR